MSARPLRVGLYARVSTDDQTTENQLRDLRAVAEQRGWTVVAEYVDHAVSGSKARAHRPAFDKLARDAAQGKIDHIAAWAVDRLGRSARDVINFAHDLPEQGCTLYLHREQLDTSTPTGRFVLTIMAALGEMELGMIRERIHAGLARARAQGKHCGRPSTSLSPKAEAEIHRLRALRPPLGIAKIARRLKIGTGKVVRVLEAATPAT